MKKFLFQSSVLLTLFILKYSIAQTHNTPPVLVAVPRTIQLPVNTKVGTVVCRVKATDHDGDEVEFALTPNPVSPYSRLPFRDGSEFFRISKRGSEAVITLSVTLVDKVKVGDQLSLSVTGLDDVSGISTRTEIPIFIEDAIADYDDEPTMTSSVSNAPLPDSSTQATPTPTVSTVETSPSKSSTSPMPSTSVPEQGSGQISEGLSEEEEAAQRSKMYIMILVPIFVVCPALGVAVFLFRSKIARWVKRHCGRSEDSDDCEIKDVTKIENAESEFFKMAPDMRKISSNSYGFSPKSGEMNKLSVLSDEDPWEFPRHQLKVLSRLGEGSFGQVWMYEADGIDRKRGKTIVAVKTVKEHSGDKKDLLHELAVMKLLDPHPNVVRLLGCCTETDPVYVIMEFVNGGTLQEFLRKSRSEHNYKNLHGESETLSARDLTSYAYQIAKGMAYLSSKKVIHRDLAARNILINLNEDGNQSCCVCKVADFGFARDVMANNIYERKSDGKLPIRWMAPESLFDNTYTTKSDIWSFGVLLWEIVTLGSTPYPGMSSSEVLKRVREGYRLEKPEHCKREIYNLMYYCWNKAPEERPDFSALVEEFEALLIVDTDYIDLNLFPEHAYYNEICLSGEKV